MTDSTESASAQLPTAGIKWYRRSWFVYLVLFFFAPIGLILAWSGPVVGRSGAWRTGYKAIVSGVFALLFGITVWVNSKSSPEGREGPAAPAQNSVEETVWSRERFYAAYEKAELPPLPKGKAYLIDNDSDPAGPDNPFAAKLTPYVKDTIMNGEPSITHYLSESFHVHLMGDPNDLRFFAVKLPAKDSGPRFVKLIRELTAERSMRPTESMNNFPEPIRNLFHTTGAVGSRTAMVFILKQAEAVVNGEDRRITKKEISWLPFERIFITSDAAQTSASFWLKQAAEDE